MALTIQVTRRQMWLARGAFATCVLMIIFLMAVGSGHITSTTDGNATIYTPVPTFSIIMGIVALLAGIVAALFWSQRAWTFKCIGIVLFLTAGCALIHAPTGLNHRVVVTPDSFSCRVGAWYAPAEQAINFDDVRYMHLDETESSRPGRKTYELQCYAEGKGWLAVPVCDMMKKALPEIFRRATARDIVIGDTADGWQIPPDLSD